MLQGKYTHPGSTHRKSQDIVNDRWRTEQPMTSILLIRNVQRRIPIQAKNIRLHFAFYFILNDIFPWENNY